MLRLLVLALVVGWWWWWMSFRAWFIFSDTDLIVAKIGSALLFLIFIASSLRPPGAMPDYAVRSRLALAISGCEVVELRRLQREALPCITLLQSISGSILSVPRLLQSLRASTKIGWNAV